MSIPRRSELVLAVFLAAFAAAGAGRAGEDPMAAYRDRFRQGMEKYRAGAMAEAIRTWSAIYEEIGPQKGYRLSFNLARAYEANSETSRAAERYQSFLDEVDRRAAAGESLDPIVEREAKEARSRLDELNAKSGRVRVVSRGSTVLTQIDTADPRLGDFVAYVAPGDHVVTFGPGSSEESKERVTLKAGEVVDVTPPPERAATQPVPSPIQPAPRNGEPPLRRLQLQRPFTPVVLYIGVGVTAASVLVPVATYAHANSLIQAHGDPATPIAQKHVIEDEYPGAKTIAYASLGVPIGLGAITAGLIAYYFGGTKEQEVILSGAVAPGGGVATVGGRF